MSTGLLLDESRDPPKDGRTWVVARSTNDAKDYITKNGVPDHVDIGNTCNSNNVDFAKWLIDQNASSNTATNFTVQVSAQNASDVVNAMAPTITK